MGHKVWVATRKSYVTSPFSRWQRVNLVHLHSPASKSLEAIVHTFTAILKARAVKTDILHIHAVGPGLLVPFAKLLGLKVVFTHHGPDYHRQKWGPLAKLALRLGEYLGCCFSDATIVISTGILKSVRPYCRKPPHLIYNGVSLPARLDTIKDLKPEKLRPEKYILAVSRFVPEKGLHLLIKAFQAMETDLCLVIAGDSDHETDYSKFLKREIDKDNRIHWTGYITGPPLNWLYTHAKLFVLPSFHEGLPIALLEALSFGLSVLVSDIPANQEVNLPKYRYFKCGNVQDLTRQMTKLAASSLTGQEKTAIRDMIEKQYNWQTIAEQTAAVYRQAAEKQNRNYRSKNSTCLWKKRL